MDTIWQEDVSLLMQCTVIWLTWNLRTWNSYYEKKYFSPKIFAHNFLLSYIKIKGSQTFLSSWSRAIFCCHSLSFYFELFFNLFQMCLWQLMKKQIPVMFYTFIQQNILFIATWFKYSMGHIIYIKRKYYIYTYYVMWIIPFMKSYNFGLDLPIFFPLWWTLCRL